MKQKKLIYLLLLSVATIWGLIFHRIFTSMNENEESIPNQAPKSQVEYLKLINHHLDKIVLDLNYRDPFLETSTSQPEINVVTEPGEMNFPVQMAMPPVEVQWPMVKYKGYISNSNSRQGVAILELNGVEALLLEGQSLQGVKLLKYGQDSIKIVYKKKVKYIRIE